MAPRCLPERRLSASCRIRPDAGGRQVQAGGRGVRQHKDVLQEEGTRQGPAPEHRPESTQTSKETGLGSTWRPCLSHHLLSAVPERPLASCWCGARLRQRNGSAAGPQHGPVSSNSVPGSGNHAVSGSHWSPRNHSWGGQAGQARAICAHLRLSALQSGDWRL